MPIFRKRHEETVTPNPEPAIERFDGHIGPLDDDNDVDYLSPSDPRRMAIRRKQVEEHRAETNLDS